MPLRSRRDRNHGRTRTPRLTCDLSVHRAVLLPLRRLPASASQGAYVRRNPSSRADVGQGDVRGGPARVDQLKRNPRVTCRECGARLFIDVLARSLRGSHPDSCCRRASSSQPLMACRSRSGPSSTTCRTTRPCRRVSAARTKWSGGRPGLAGRISVPRLRVQHGRLNRVAVAESPRRYLRPVA